MKERLSLFFFSSILALGFLLAGCNNVKDAEAVFIGKSNKSIPISDYLKKNVQLMVVNESDSLLIGEVSKMYETEEGWIILDRRKTKGLYMVNRKGAIIAHFNHQGQGPEEYISIYDFDVDEENKEIYILCYPSKIMVTDYTFNRKKTHPLAEIYGSVACFDHHVYLYSDRAVFLFSPASGQISEVLNEGSLKQIWGNLHAVFHKVGDELFYIAHGGDKLYKLKNGKALPFLTIDFENKEEIYQLMRGDEALIGLEHLTKYPPKIHAIFETPQKTLCLVYSKPVYGLCEISLKDYTVINEGQLISVLPNFYVCQPNRKHLTGVAIDQLKDVYKKIQIASEEMIVEPSLNQLNNGEEDEEDRLVIVSCELK
jgi:hypothetical protein